MGELDSLICAKHPDCDPQTKAVHACGHHAQAAGLVGAAAALKEPGVLDGLCGSIRLMAVPAEELIEVGYREKLRAEGKIEFFGGKVEFMNRGYFEDVDLCVLIHTFDDPGLKHVYQLAHGNNGCIVKTLRCTVWLRMRVDLRIRESTRCMRQCRPLQAFSALRETFRDDEHIRFHPIITEGGQAVNAIPDEVKIESYVRGASLEAIDQANRRINRAIAASVAAMGATVTLQDRPGYCPMHDDELMNEAALAAMKRIVSEDEILIQTQWGTGCTDMGDLSAVLPTIQPGSSGSIGAYHGKDFQIVDPEKAYIIPAKALVFIADELLQNEAEKPRKS
ncbi:MAG: M20/M25/M40 family metallo-hydrolase [Holdemania massiliensis]